MPRYPLLMLFMELFDDLVGVLPSWSQDFHAELVVFSHNHLLVDGFLIHSNSTLIVRLIKEL